MHQIYSETISHGQRHFLNMLKTRELRQFCTDNNISFVFLYNITTGKVSPPCPLIFKLRNIVYPDCWFYDEDEPLPDRLQFTDKITEWDVEQTIAMKKLLGIPIEKLRSWTVERNIDFMSIYMVYHRRHLPSFKKIKSLRNIFTPATWFVTDEEVKG